VLCGGAQARRRGGGAGAWASRRKERVEGTPPQPMAKRRRRSSRATISTQRRCPATARAAASRGRLATRASAGLARRLFLPAEAPLWQRGSSVSCACVRTMGGGSSAVAVHSGAAGPPPATESRKTSIPLPPRRRERPRPHEGCPASECLMKQHVRRRAGRRRPAASRCAPLREAVSETLERPQCLADLLRRRDVRAADLVTTPRRAPNANRGWTVFEIPSTPGSLPAVGSATCGPDRARFARAGTRSVRRRLHRLAARGEPSGAMLEAGCWQRDAAAVLGLDGECPTADDAGDLAASSFKRSSPGHLQVWAKRPWARARRWQPAGLGRPQMRAVAGLNHVAAFAGARLPHAPSLQRGFPLGDGSRA
jgi:hypothetical protein